MKRLTMFSIITLLIVGSGSSVYGQAKCDFSILGIWRAATTALDDAIPTFYGFNSDGTVSVLSGLFSDSGSEPQEVVRAKYYLDKPNAPTRIGFDSLNVLGTSTQQSTAMEVISFDESSLVFMNPLFGKTRWVKVSSNRYYLIFAGRESDLSHGSATGHAFVIWLELGKRQTISTEAFGFYPAKGIGLFGPVPGKIRDELRKDSTSGINRNVELCIEVTPAEYERSQTVRKDWDSRANAETLPYRLSSSNCVVFMESVAKSLNQCNQRLRLSGSANLEFPANYVKGLRRLNNNLHVTPEQMYNLHRRQ